MTVVLESVQQLQHLQQLMAEDLVSHIGLHNLTCISCSKSQAQLCKIPELVERMLLSFDHEVAAKVLRMADLIMRKQVCQYGAINVSVSIVPVKQLGH